eukprot:TRINITY_DN1815_c0_g1_i1.p1 TRINITY_DN1815_c0_g1~~TRINITY_DN1815_c0_g1_i1.p1  ORF type:complete len:347 (-),score=103.92 TRINITY_DN1815_c0_g1_i1:29-1069(-)
MAGFKIGVPGKQYGLVKSTPKPINPLFSADDDDAPKSMNEALKREAERNKKMKKAAVEHQKILEADPNAFDYDGMYDSMKSKEEEFSLRKKSESSMQRKPKYMGDILKKAKEREREQEVIYDKMLQKEKEKNEKEFGDKDMFVTSAYKKKLLEDQKWEREEAEREKREGSVYKTNDMSGFYANLLNNNVAMGTAKKQSEAPTKGAAAPPTSSSKGPQAAPPAAKPAAAGPSKDSAPTKDDREKSPPRERSSSRDDESTRRSGSRDEERSRSRDKRSPSREEGREDESKKRPLQELSKEDEELKKKQQEEEEAKKFARRNTETAVADARARYLARKQAQAGAEPAKS